MPMASGNSDQINIDGLRYLVEAYGNSDDSDEEEGTIHKYQNGINRNVLDDLCSEKVKRTRTGTTEDKLPVPSDIKEMFIPPNQIERHHDENDNSHGGRKRTFAHVRGNWASFVYLPFSREEDVTKVLAKLVERSITGKEPSPITLNEEFHLSLTKTMVLHHHWLEPFILSLRKVLKGLKRFNVVFTEFDVYLNEENERTFIGINLFPSDTLQRLTREFDNCLKQYNLEPFYDNPSFHVSIAWCVGNEETWIRSHLLPYLNSAWSKVLDENSELQIASICAIKLKTGNKIHKFTLNS